MSNRLFDTALQIHDKQTVKNLINIYSKVDKQSDDIAKKASKKHSQFIQIDNKEITSEDVLKMIKKPNKPSTPSLNKSRQSRVKEQVQKKSQSKNRISNLKALINVEQKSLNTTKKTIVSTSKQQTEYMIFKMKLLGKRVSDVQVSITRNLIKDAFAKIKTDWMEVRQLQSRFILKRYRKLLKKYFDEFYKQTIILKLQREKFERKQWLQRQQKNQKIAQDFNQFMLYKKSIASWKINYQKSKRQKRQVSVSQKVSQGNELKNKLANFLNKMKEQMTEPEQKIQQTKYNTIKEEFQQFEQSKTNDWQRQQNNQQQNQIQNNQAQKPSKNQQPLKKMTNQDLIKKRMQLQLKNKQRKETLEKLKKQKDQLKIKAEQQKRAQQEKLKEQQKRKRKQDHDRFLQKRKQQQEKRKNEELQRKRMDNLFVLAEQHNKHRILKYKGLVPWKKLLSIRNQNLLKLANAIDRLKLLCSWKWFMEAYSIRDKLLKEEQNIKDQKADQHYRKKMKKKIINFIKQYNSTVVFEENNFLSRFRQQHILKEVISYWKKYLPEMKEENYQQQSKQNQIVQSFRYKFLIRAGFDSFYFNKQQQQKQRRILEHKTKLKQKMQELMGPRPKLDIDKLL